MASAQPLPQPSPQLDPKRIPEPQAFVEGFGAFALDGTESKAMRPAEAAPDKVKQWSNFSAPETIRSICISKVPGWSALKPSEIVVDQILVGLSNQLFKVHVVANREDTSAVTPCVLFRIYGTEVATLIDPQVELNLFKTLSSYQIAPRMYGHDVQWRIEEWHFAVSLKCRYMRNPSILTQVASALARFHKLSSRSDFPRDLRNLPPSSLQRMQTWSSGCERAAARAASHPETSRALDQLNLPEVVEEQAWLRDYVIADDPHIRGSGLDIVFSHNDLQENNILQTQYGLRFIDFEYSWMDYQATDIANYFCECTIDYVADKYPFYTMSLSDYPTEWEQRLFCSIYLSEYLEARITLEDPAVTRLLQRVKRFTLVSHYLWTIWSVVRAPAEINFSDFDFLHYAQARWDSYKRAKFDLLMTEEMPRSRTVTPNQSFADLSHADLQSEATAPHTPAHDSKEGPKKNPYILGGALTGGGVLVGVVAVVLTMKLLKR